MKGIYEVIKREIIGVYVGVEDPFYQNIFTILFITIIGLILAVLIKVTIVWIKLEKENKKIKRRIDKYWVRFMRGPRDKNIEKRNI